jgi:hypothetical protein
MRARCFRCGTDFPVEQTITRLLDAQAGSPCQIDEPTKDSHVTCGLAEETIAESRDGSPSFGESLTADEPAPVSSSAVPLTSQEAYGPTVITDTTTLQSECLYPAEPEDELKETAKSEINFEHPNQEALEIEIPTSETSVEHLAIEEAAAMAEGGILTEESRVTSISLEETIGEESGELPSFGESLTADEPASASSVAVPLSPQEASEPTVIIDTATLHESLSIAEPEDEPKETGKSEINFEHPNQEAPEVEIPTSETSVEHLTIEEEAAMAEGEILTEESRTTGASAKEAIAEAHDGLPSFGESLTADEPTPANSEAVSLLPKEASEPTVIIDTTTLRSESLSPAKTIDESKEAVKPEINFEPPNQEAPEIEIPTSETSVSTAEVIDKPAPANIKAAPLPTQEASEPTVIIDTAALRSKSLSPAQPTDKPKETAKPEINLERPRQESPEFKIRTSETLIEHLTIEEVAAMAEDGRLKEYHLVARQSSENWIEAPKVSALRPIYDKRRYLLNPEPPPISELETPKRGLFRRLFGRN